MAYLRGFGKQLLQLAVIIFLLFSGNQSLAQNANCYGPYNSTPASVWGVEEKFKGNAVVWSGATPTAADLDGDGISELLVTSTSKSGYYVYKGDGSNKTTATIKYIIANTADRSVQPAIGDIISSSSGPEVVMVNSAGFLFIFNNIAGSETNYLYKSTTASQYDNTNTFPLTKSATPYIVDIDEDGTAEIVLGSDVFGIVNGALVKRLSGLPLNYSGQTSGSTGTPIDVVVVDIIASNPGKELVYGSRVYSMNLSTGTMTVLKDLSTIAGSGAAAGDNGPTAVADMDLDGDLDIIYNGSTNVYMWDPNQSLVLFKRVPPSFNYGVRSLPMIANVYNEKVNNAKTTDLPEAIFINSVSNAVGIFTAYNLNFTTATGSTNQYVWSLTSNDWSGCTGITAFDFDGNGIREIVYRDMTTLRIINGNLATPTNYATIASGSATWGEYPIVGDFDNDGQADIAVTGNNMLGVYQRAVNTFDWQDAPNYWNQRNYRIVNINPNLTIPTTESNSAGSASINNNLTQLQYLDAAPGTSAPYGTTAVSDATIAITSVTGPCPALTVLSTITNNGLAVLKAGTTIALYNGNPTTTNAVLVGTYVTTAAVAPGATLNVTIPLNVSINIATLYAVVNDLGTTARPYNLATQFPNSSIIECNYTNNMAFTAVVCLDSDNDGTSDVVDLDDDNDGTLDATESPACFFNANEWNTTNKSNFVTISSELDLLAPNTAIQNLANGIGGTTAAMQYETTPAQSQLNKELLKFEFFQPTQLDAIYIQKTSAVQLFAATAASLKVQASNNNTTWTDVTAAITLPANVTNVTANGAVSLTNSNKFVLTTNLASYKYYRIYGVVAANVLTGVASEVYFDVNTSAYQQSAFPKPGTCSVDLDNDTKPNHLDSDSDGDGCSDAKEAGATTSNTANFAFTTAVGTNGLADALETATDNAALNYASTYDPVAISTNIAECADTDIDGILNPNDIDDDNDGILDIVESPSCFYFRNDWNLIDKSVHATVSSELNTLAPNTSFASLTDGIGGTTAAVQFVTATAQAQLNKELFKVTFSKAVQLDAWYIKKTSATQIFAATAASLRVQGSNNNTTWNDLTAAIASPADVTNVTANGAVSLTNSNKFIITQNAAKYKYYRIYGVVAGNVLAGIASEFYFDVNATGYDASIFPRAVCNSDTDGDGIFNYLDLDSDGDSCSDALEAGATTNPTANFAFPAASVGVNGLSDGLETVADNGTINYTSTHINAISNGISYCADTDQDGIGNTDDIDDDNDGILDAVESPSCFYLSSDWLQGDRSQILVTTQLAMTAGQDQPNKIVNGTTSATNYDVRFVGTTTGTPKEIFRFEMPSPIALSKIYLGYTTATTVFGASTGITVRGSMDGSTWTNLSAQTTYAVGPTLGAVPGVAGITPASEFTVTQNVGKYRYYALVWTGGGSITNGSYVNEAYFKTDVSYVPSSAPKPVCNNDTDGDGKPNHIDTDSDGDGCSDIVEAGVSTTVTATVLTGTVGANGFANAVETTPESSTYNGTYTYTIARDASVNACTDSDGDGTTNVKDLDDDNDGILDTVECPAPGVTPLTPKFNIASGAAQTQTITGFPDELYIDIFDIDNNFSLNVNGTYITSVQEINLAWSGGLEYTAGSTWATLPDGTFLNGGSTWTYSGTKQLLRVVVNKFGDVKLMGLNQTTNTYQEMILRSASFNQVPINLTGTNTFTLDQDNQYSPTYANAEFNALYNSGFCDTDGDGIPNGLDLDSDGDGCFDAIEAKVLATSSTGIISGPYGANGFADSKETATESGVYNNVYFYNYALVSGNNYCTDSDNDGIKDIVDIDDDNDGVLDAVESPTCFYSITEISKPVAAYTELNTYGLTNATYFMPNAIDGNTATISAFAIGQNWVGKSIIELEAAEYTAINSITFDCKTWPISTAAANTFKLQGSGDGINWVDLSAAQASLTTVPATLVVANTLVPNGIYKYFRLVGVAGVSGYGGIAEATFNIPATSNSSMFPKASCTTDLDADTKLNHLDLDSDGDGCSDAIEAGSSTTATSTTVYPTGTDTNTNGLLNNYEGATAGTVNYTSTYTNYALSTSFNVCTDTDGDGIGDLVDLDDDNDGVLDAVESPSCFFGQNEWNTADKSVFASISSQLNALAPNTNYNAFTDNNGVTAAVQFATATAQSQLNKELFKVTFTRPLQLDAIYVQKTTATQIFAATAASLKLQGSNDDVSWTDLTAAIASPVNAINVTANGAVSLSNSNKFTITTNAGSYKYYRIYGVVAANVLAGIASEFYFDVNTATYSSSSFPLSACTEDTDNDGTYNHLDLDSDGDACSDAIESGSSTTATSTSVYPTGTDANANGLLNNYEGAAAGSVNYESTYSDYALTTSLNGCTDTDSDGITDVKDIDDDNDGVLDNQECSCVASLLPKTGIVVSSPVTWTYANGATSLQALVDGVDGSIFVANTTATFTNAPILQFDLPSAKVLTQIELGNYPGQTPLVVNGTFKMQGWDGTQWGDIGINQVIANTAPINATNNSIKFNMVNNLIAFSKYRIFGVTAVGSGVWAQEAYFTQKTCNDIDTDSDGIPNRLDLDSDGDACADAIEASSSTTATNTATYPTGADANTNGLNDNYELSTLGGSYNYTSTYEDYALSNTINACLDTDTDGITDFIDIDDDNDGILDAAEMTACATMWTPTAATSSPFYGSSNASLTINNSGLNGSGLTATVDVPNTLSDTWYLLEPNTTGFLEYTLPANTTVGGVVLWAPDATNYGGGDGPVKDFKVEVIYNNVITYTSPTYTTAQPIGAGSNGGAQVFYLPKSFVNPQKIRLIITAGWYDVNNNNGIQVGTETLAPGTVNGAYNMTLSEFKVICAPVDIDTDGDGIPNRLDLDSDGDACADAIEAGGSTTATSTSAYPSGTDANSNGLLNNYEGATSGTISYTSTYTEYALINTINMCTDSDVDGVSDFFDIDDDNDGVFDAVESPTCFFTANEWNTAAKSYFAKFSSQLSPSATNNFNALGDGNATTAAVQIQASQDQNNKELFKIEMMKPTQLDAIYIKKTTATQIFGTTAASLKVQGSNNNSTWTDLTAAIASPADATNITANGAVSLTNSNKFTLSSNPGAYKYFRIYGVAASNTVGGIASEIYFDVNVPTYNASRYPKATCISDSDGDGTQNHLDLDSDNDGCSDANEAYNTSTAQGTDGNMYYGTGNPPATNANGSVTAATYPGTNANVLAVGSASVITTQPSNQTITSGGSTTFSATVTPGSGTTTYQWQVSTNNSASWTNVTNSSTYSGAATTTLSVANATLGMNGYQYQLLISQSNYICGNITTTPATLTIGGLIQVVNDNASTLEDTPLTGSVTLNDVGSGGSAVTVNTFTINGTTYNAGQTAVIAGVGTIIINSNGTYTFTPASNFNGNVPSISYSATDGNASTGNGLLAIVVTAVNDAPIVDNETITTNEDTPATGDLTDAGDSDPDGTALTANTTPVSGPSNGTIVISPDGTYTYTPNPNFNGTDVIVVSICDAGTPLPGVCVNDTITVTVAPVNDAPIVDNEVVTTNEDTPVTGDLTDAGDTDPDGTALTANTTPVSGPSNGTIVINPDGTYTYTPNANFNGTDTIVVSICDAGLPLPGVCVNDTITVTVLPVNDAPIVDNEVVITNEDTPVTGDLTDAGDADPDGTPLTVNTTPVSGPTNGTIVINPDGTYTYTPNSGFSGTDVIVVSVCDAGLPLPSVCVNDTITVTVSPVNDAPIVDNEVVTTNEDTPATGDLTDTGDTDPDGTPLTANTTPVSGPSNGTIVINPDGTYTYTPNANFNGTDTIVVSICDAGLPLPGVCVNDTITVTVAPVNDAPIVDNEVVTTNEDTPVTGDLTDVGDADPDGTPLTVNTTPVSGPTNGTIVINPDGTYTYTPNSGFSGTDVIVVSVCDAGTPGVICINDTINITVNPLNDAPIVDNEVVTTNEDTPVTGDLTDAGDADPDGTPLTVNTTPVSGPTNGTIVINPDGTYTYTPNPGFSGTDVIVVSICDAGLPLPGVCVNDTITVTVAPVNDAPIVDNEVVTTNEDTPATGDLTDTGDTDPDGTPLTANTTPVSGPSNGTIVINPDGTYTYTPNANFNGTDIIVVSICDAGTPLPGVCVNDTITVTVAPVNDAPIVDNEVVTTNEDTPVTGDLTDAGDADPDGTPLTVNTTPVSGPTNGTIVINPDGTYTYTPNPEFSGTDVIVVSVCDAGTPGVICINDTINITVNAVNDAPIAVDNINVVTPEDVPVTGNVLTNDSDPDGDAITVSQFTIAGVPGIFTAGTTATIPGVGTIVINANGSYTFTPNANYNGPVPAITYTASDSNGGTDTATLGITVSPVNDAPIAIDDVVTATEDTPVTGNVLINDTDADGNTLTVSQITVNGITYPAGTTATIPGVGAIVVNANGTYTFTPALDYTGNVPDIFYTVVDGNGGSDTGLLDIIVNAVNDAPLATDDIVVTPEDVPVSGNVLTNDTDLEGDPLSVTQFTIAGVAGIFTAGQTATIPGVGTIVVNANGTYTFTPVLNYTGTVPDITYTVTDGTSTDTAVISIFVAPVNDAPVANNDANTVLEDNPATGNVLTNDTDTDTPLANLEVTQITFTVGGTAYTYPSGSTVTIPGVGTIIVNTNGTYTFTPNNNWNGTVPVITYTVSDGEGGVDTGTLILTVTAVNDAPITVNDDNIVTPENTPVTGNVLTNDSDPEGNPLTVSQFTIAGISGTFTAGTTATIPGVGTIVINANGSYTFTPNANYNGPVPVITYTAVDSNGGTGTANLGITVMDVNYAPVAVDDAISASEDTPINGNVLTNDTDADGNTLAVADFTVNGVTYPVGTTANIPNVGTIVVNANGTFTFTPVPNYTGTAPTITYTVGDGNGGTDIGALVLTVSPVNDAPIVDNEVVTTNEDTPATGDLTDTGDTDPDGTPLTANTTPVSGPTNGTIVINPDGTYTYTPNANFNGTDIIVVSICDAGTPGVICINDTINITVNPINDAPIVDNEIETTPEDTPVSGDLTDAGDTDPDGTPLTVNTTPVSGPTNGTIVINPDGTYTYTPNPGFSGTDVIVVSICDAGLPLPGVCVNDTIFITVAPVNDAPIVDNEVVTTNEDTPATGDLTDTGDTDPDGTPLTANTTPVSGPSNGTIVINPDGTYTYTPNANFNGTDVVVVSICDAGTPGVICINDTINITVNPLNDAPIVDNEVVTTNEDTPVSGDLTDAGDSDPDGTPLTVNTTPVSGPTNGTIVINPDGTYTYTPNPGFSGTDVIVVSICDAGLPLPGVCVNDTITVTVEPITETNPDMNVTQLNIPVNGDLGTNDNMPTGSTYGTPIGNPSNPAGGTIAMNPDGTYTFTGTNMGVYTYNVPVCAPGQTTNCPTEELIITVLDPNSTTNNPINNTDLATSTTTTPVVINGLSNDASGNSGGSLNPGSLIITDAPNHGTATVNPVTGAVTYTAAVGFVGTDTLVYQVCDNSSPTPLCGTAMQIITVLPANGVNDGPEASDDYASTVGSTPVSGNVLINDTDPEGNTLNVTPQTTTIPGKGTLVLNADGTYTFTPVSGFTGTVDVPYTACDNGIPQECTQATLYITYRVSNTPLYVNLFSFKAKSNGCDIDLLWEAKSEVNLSRYEILRKVEGSSEFVKITTVNSKGMNNGSVTYQYKDNDLQSFKRYEYKLKMVDMDSKYSFSKTEWVKLDCSPKEEIAVYPNPIRGNELYIDLYNEIGTDYKLSLVDMTGRKILESSKTLSNERETVSLSTHHIAPGVYHLLVETLHSKVISYKIIKE